MAVLKHEEIISRLKNFSGWNFVNNQIEKEFSFENFAEALAFVNKVGLIAESLDHHPDILLHSWNKVKITVSTHSEGGVTEKDFNLANKMEELI
jgi:4a-hydroxytetrahydrobiopterin dehydratase